jgi:hypothetical protein
MVLGSDLRHSGTRRGRGTAAAAALLLVLGPAVAACSDDDGGGGGATPPSPTAERTGRSPAATAPADAQAAVTEIKDNWQKFFDPKTSLEDKQAVLENGDRMAPVLRAFSGDERGGQVQAKVSKVEFTAGRVRDRRRAGRHLEGVHEDAVRAGPDERQWVADPGVLRRRSP